MLTLKIEAPSDIPAPPAGKVTLFMDSTNSNTPSYKSSDDVVHTLVGAAGATGPAGIAGVPGPTGATGPAGSAATVTKVAVLAALSIPDLTVSADIVSLTLSGGVINLGPAEP